MLGAGCSAPQRKKRKNCDVWRGRAIAKNGIPNSPCILPHNRRLFLLGSEIMSRLYLIDSMSLVFRAYYAMARSSRPLTAPNGEPTGAVFGFASILTSLLEKENVDYIACVFDTKEPTFRHKMYNQYKAANQPERYLGLQAF